MSAANNEAFESDAAAESRASKNEDTTLYENALYDRTSQPLPDTGSSTLPHHAGDTSHVSGLFTFVSFVHNVVNFMCANER